MAEPYTSELRAELPEHLERIASRDYVGVNEGFWICSDAAHEIRALRARVKALEEGLRPFAKEAVTWEACVAKDDVFPWMSLGGEYGALPTDFSFGDLRRAAKLMESE